MRSEPTLRTSDWTPTERLLLFLVPGRSVPPAVNLKMFIREGYIPSLPSAWEPQMILCVKRRSLTRELAVRSIGPRVVLEVIALLSITSAVPALSAELNDCGCVKIKTETVENKTTARATTRIVVTGRSAALTAPAPIPAAGTSAQIFIGSWW
jgi:hypothetical protein